MKTFIAKLGGGINAASAWAIGKLEAWLAKVSAWTDRKSLDTTTGGAPVTEPSPYRTAAVLALLTMLTISTAYGVFVGSQRIYQLAALGMTTSPATKQVKWAPRPPAPVDENVSLGWWARRAVTKDERPVIFMVPGASRIKTGEIVSGKWVCLAGDAKLTYDYLSQRWE